MQLLTAKLLLSLIVLSGAFTPLLEAFSAQLPHACCLRNGKHHCMGSLSNEVGFRAAQRACPYSTPQMLTSVSALEPGSLKIGSPNIARFIVGTISHSDSRSTLRCLSTRAPPASLL